MNKTELKRIIANYEAMKKPQPCRPLTWAELMKVRKATPLVIEYRERREGRGLIMWRIVCVNSKQARALNKNATGEKGNYNRTFRFWPCMPSRRERKAAKWEA